MTTEFGNKEMTIDLCKRNCGKMMGTKALLKCVPEKMEKEEQEAVALGQLLQEVLLQRKKESR